MNHALQSEKSMIYIYVHAHALKRRSPELMLWQCQQCLKVNGSRRTLKSLVVIFKVRVFPRDQNLKNHVNTREPCWYG